MAEILQYDLPRLGGRGPRGRLLASPGRPGRPVTMQTVLAA
jgi:hypothetical protein